MIHRLEVAGLRALRHVSVDLSGFHLLVGANATGKSTFFEAIHLLRDILVSGLDHAIQGSAAEGIPQRAEDPIDLTWMRRGEPIAVALTVAVPDKYRLHSPYRFCRFEIVLNTTPDLKILHEELWLCEDMPGAVARADLLGPPCPPREHPPGWRDVVSRLREDPGHTTFVPERGDAPYTFRLGLGKSALASLPEDVNQFGVALWFRDYLTESLCRVALSPDAMRLPSPPGRHKGFLPDGSNLPWAIQDLERSNQERLHEWVDHVRTALPDLKSIFTREREENRARYVVLEYANGLIAPSWLLSDGTLRLLALTLLAYLREPPSMVLVEEPENGVHPSAIETVMQSLTSMWESQVFCATHSPVVLGLLKKEQILCFSKGVNGAVSIQDGAHHPRLQDWQGRLTLGELFAAGVLS